MTRAWVHVLLALCGLLVVAHLPRSCASSAASGDTLERAHDVAIAEAGVRRDSIRRVAVHVERAHVRPALTRDAAARQQLRRVLAADTELLRADALDVPALRTALAVTITAAAASDTASRAAIGALSVLVTAEQAHAAAADTLAAVAVHALEAERTDRGRERWVYRAKLAGGVVAGVLLGALVAR